MDNASTTRGQNHGGSTAGTTNQGTGNQNNMGPPANVYAQDAQAIDPVVVINWGGSDASTTSLFSHTPRGDAASIHN